MYWYAHLFFGVGVVSFFTLDPVVLALAAFLSVLPDLDKPFGHRKWFSHSLVAALIFSVTGFVASSFNLIYAWVVFLSFSSHILLDLLTKSGVPILYPGDKKARGLRLFSANNRPAAKAVVILGVFLLLYNIFQVYPLFNIL